jgi:hypothetical protein
MITAPLQVIIILIGLLTAGSFIFFLVPGLFAKVILGTLEAGPILLLLTRHWAFLVFLIGAFLISAAFIPAWRLPALLITFLEKFSFAVLVFVGPFKNSRPARLAALGDGLLALVCLTCLFWL